MGARVLFISHEASRTGAPISLLHLQRWLRRHTDVRIQTLVLRNGPLLSEFAGVGRVTSLDIRATPGAYRLARRFGEHLPQQGPSWLDERSIIERTLRRRAETATWRYFSKVLRSLGPQDLYYANSTASVDVLQHVPSSAPSLVHVHEMPFELLNHEAPSNVDLLRSRDWPVIACSNAVRDGLIASIGVAKHRITVCYEPTPAVEGTANTSRGRETRLMLGIPPNSFVVGGSGMQDWRKGSDLFVQVALRVRRARPDSLIRFVWVGGTADRPSYAQMEYDAHRAGVGDIVQVVPQTSTPNHYFQAFDAFALTSRSDPFPLVCLEAAALGKPVICFADAGGMPEFIEHDAGKVVPYLDIDAMAAEILSMSTDPGARTRMGKAAQQKILSGFGIDRRGPEIWGVMRASLSQGRS